MNSEKNGLSLHDKELKTDIMAKNDFGYVYILTNPSFREDWVKIGKSENTVSRWSTNKVQSSIQQLNDIAQILDVDVRTLITST